MERKNRLYRSRSNRMIAGVCGGFADYFNLDPVLMRIGAVMLTLISGPVLIFMYILSIIIIPESPYEEVEQGEIAGEKSSRARKYLPGVIIISIGILFIVNGFQLLPWSLWGLREIPWGIIWGIFLISLGALLLFPKRGKTEEGKKITRSSDEKMIAGVCGGLAKYFDTDPSFIRLTWVLGTIASVGIGILAYIIALILMPKERSTQQNM